MIRFLILCVLGVICILAGKKGWKYPGIFEFLRSTTFGEILNTIVMVSGGVVLIILAFTLLIDK